MANSKISFKVGDLVELKSGGPPMTVEDPAHFSLDRKSATVRCTWFAGKKHEVGYFNADVLMTYTPPEKE